MKIIDGCIVIPVPGTGATYDVALSECSTRERINQWLLHLEEKMWVTPSMLADFKQIAESRLLK